MSTATAAEVLKARGFDAQAEHVRKLEKEKAELAAELEVAVSEWSSWRERALAAEAKLAQQEPCAICRSRPRVGAGTVCEVCR